MNLKYYIIIPVFVFLFAVIVILLIYLFSESMFQEEPILIRFTVYDEVFGSSQTFIFGNQEQLASLDHKFSRDDLAGLNDYENRIIYVRSDRGTEKCLRTLSHEISHMVFDRLADKYLGLDKELLGYYTGYWLEQSARGCL